MELEAGMRAGLTRTVAERHTAPTFGSGDVMVLATPQLIAWCEEASVLVLDDVLEPGSTTVGMRIRLDHVQPTPVGGEIRVEAVLALIEGRRLTFEVTACEGDITIAHGQVVRVIVDRARFMDRAGAR